MSPMSPAGVARLARDEDGSAALEMAILAPVMLVFIALAIMAMRIELAGGSVELAAHDAARAASISRTAGTADANAHAAAAATLRSEGLTCASSSVSVDTSGFATRIGQNAVVRVTVTCRVRLADIAAPGLPGARTETATFTSPLDRFRTRG